MSLTVEKTPIEGLLLLRPKVFRDARGFFTESYNRQVFAAAGISTEFVQDNHSRSEGGTLRGLHFQAGPGQVKLVRCSRGRVWDVAADIRPGSPTFGRHHGVILTPEDCAMLYVPAGFAHGFLALEEAEVQYKCSTVYDAAIETGIMWDDPELKVAWPLDAIEGGTPILSQRDRTNQSFAEWRSGNT
jgi:dTDP-4-dehydrorhamnose 3,5-epimerase